MVSEIEMIATFWGGGVLALAPSVKVAMSGRIIVEIWQLPAPGLSEEALGADVVYGQRGSSDPL